MKLQIRDAKTWALLAEADLTGKTFTVIGDNFVCNADISFPVFLSGTANREGFLVTDKGEFIRVIDLTLSSHDLSYGNTITIPAGNLRWGRT